MATRYALVVAAQQYAHAARFRPLKKSLADARAVAALLSGSERFGIPAENLTLLDDRPWHEVQPAVEKFFRNPALQRDDLLLFYFAGHGERVGSGDQLCLILRDSDPEAINSTSLASGQLRDWMNRSKAKRQLVILDCCYSGAFEGRSSELLPKDALATEAEHGDIEARFVLAATDKTTIASEREEGNADSPNALYTGCLLDALQGGAAANEAGAITVQSLHRHLQRAVREKSNGRQTPRIIPYAGSDLTLVASPHLPLPEEVLALAADGDGDKRLSAVPRIVFAADEEPRRQRAAQRELQRLCEDRDRWVAQAARKALDELNPPSA